MTADPATSTGKPATRYYQPAPATTSRRQRRPSGAQSAALLGYLWLLLVVVCVGAMSWTGLVRFAKDVLGLPVPLRYGVPVALDGSAITLAFLALRGVLSGGAAGLPRLLAVIVVAASSGFNYYQARQTGQGGAAEVFFAGMSVLVYVMFEVILRHNRRQHLAELGAIEPPLARFRLARWLRFPWRTLSAWSVAIDQGLTDPQAALEVVRHRPRRQHWWSRRSRSLQRPLPVAKEVATDPLPTLEVHGPEPAPWPGGAPAKQPQDGEARRIVRELLLERGDALTGRQAAEATGKSRSRAQQLITAEKAALAEAARGRNGSTP